MTIRADRTSQLPALAAVCVTALVIAGICASVAAFATAVSAGSAARGADPGAKMLGCTARDGESLCVYSGDESLVVVRCRGVECSAPVKLVEAR